MIATPAQRRRDIEHRLVSTRRGQLVELARVITACPALLTREQQIFAR